MNRFLARLLFTFLLVSGSGNSISFAVHPLAINSISPNPSVTFLENNGQWPSEIIYQAMSVSTNAYLMKEGLSFAQKLKGDLAKEQSTIVWNMKFHHMNTDAFIDGSRGRESVYTYLMGSTEKDWVVHPKEYEEIRYNNIYENVDLKIYGIGSQLKYDYVLHKGSKVNSIEAYYEGIRNLRINEDGSLEIKTASCTQVQKSPESWQVIDGVKVPVRISYRLVNDSTFGFAAAESYNENFDLIIDPLFQLVWSSYTLATGASNNINYCFSNAMDNNGNVYLTGMVDGTFPTTPGSYAGPGGISPDIFVAKFSSDGTTLLYSTYLPGNSLEHGTGIAVDALGQAYVTGVVEVNFTGMTTFPSTANAYQPVHDAGPDAFLTVLNSSGSGLLYSTFLGGTGSDVGYGIALGQPGTAYITGTTSIGNFPVKASQVYPTGSKDIFVAKFDINQSGNNSLVYSVRIGAGSFSFCSGNGIAVNAAGNAFITGSVSSNVNTPTFPLTAGVYNSTYNTGQDGGIAYVAKLTPGTPVSLSYATYIGPGSGNAVAVDAATDEAIVGGGTRTFTFPVTAGVLQDIHGQDALGNPNNDAFVVRMNASASALIYSTFLGGPRADHASGVAVNSAGEAYVTGVSQDLFPTSPGSIQPNNAGSEDFFVVHLNANGTGYSCGGSTYFGGSDEDYTGSFYDYLSPHLSLRDHGGTNDTILISSTSHSQDFPTTPGVYGPTKINGIADQPVFFKLTCALVNLPPQAFFNSEINSSCAGATVNFTDSTLNSPTSWLWTFPGAIPDSSSQQNPQGVFFPSTGQYTVTLVSCNGAGCDTSSASIQINTTAPQTINIGNDTIVCPGNSITLVAPAGFSGNTWHYNGTAVGTNLPQLSVSQQGEYSLVVTDSLGCIAADTMIMAISEPAISLGPDFALCNSDSVLLTATPGYATYNWEINGTSLTSTNASIYSTQPGIYSVSVTDSIGCSASDTAQAIASSIQLMPLSDTSICGGQSVTIDAGPGFVSYAWEFQGGIVSQTSSVLISQSGNYVLTVTNQDNCEASDDLNVNIQPGPVIHTTPNTEVCRGSTVLLTASGASTYSWSPSSYLSSATSSSPWSTPLTDISYVVTGTDAFGCTSSNTVSIMVNEIPLASFDYSLEASCDFIILSAVNRSQNAAQYIWSFGDGTYSSETNVIHTYVALQNQSLSLIARNGVCSDTSTVENLSADKNYEGFFYVPNSFTPNGDDFNNEFIVASENDCDFFHLDIFNRWGELIYTTEGKEVSWDGTYKSNNAPEGVYVYVIKSRNMEKVGHVTLIR